MSNIYPRSLPAIARIPNAAGLFTQDEARTLGTDFAFAYASSMEHLSADSSMFQIIVPAGVEGTYIAVVTASEVVEYRCIILQPYTDRLHCIGPPLPEASQISLRIFKIDELYGTQILVFETNYTTGEIAALATPSPTYTPTPTQTPTFTHTPIRSLVRTADESGSGSDDDPPPPATLAATEPPEPTEPPPPPPPEPTDKPKPCNKGHPENCPPTPDS